MADMGWSRYIADQEAAHYGACIEAAGLAGFTPAEAEDCNEGARKCPRCPFVQRAEPLPPVEWVTLCKRTDDPKLAYIEQRLDELRIPHRRNGESFHAPILEVPAEHEAAGWALLCTKVNQLTLDEIRDDAPMFRRAADGF